MWVVKIGGSLCDDPLLPQWLDLLATLGGGRVTVVSGGAGFADEVRRAQRRWRFDDLAAHNMAVLAMVQFAYLMRALEPQLHAAACEADIRRVLKAGRTALWVPFELQRDAPDADTHWGHTSDSIALDLARHLNAERLVLVKSCPVDPAASLDQLGELGIVDAQFATRSRQADFPIEVLPRENLERMRGLLLGTVHPQGG
ncbi:Aspartate kinase [Rubrivivax sp. A210]|uniref:amino acid kinase family protein n=1 Tax=Rubrivivax sp. A210 TaxID=2772301 RepID=UPI00191A14DA|nr:aspartate kinase [Rubrivivax sp. A210]CAD5372161.1 Aspartate kinase [Rubrivivax sp. A210]